MVGKTKSTGGSHGAHAAIIGISLVALLMSCANMLTGNDLKEKIGADVAAANAAVFFVTPSATAPWSRMSITRDGNCGRASGGIGNGATIGAMGSPPHGSGVAAAAAEMRAMAREKPRARRGSVAVRMTQTIMA